MKLTPKLFPLSGNKWAVIVNRAAVCVLDLDNFHIGAMNQGELLQSIFTKKELQKVLKRLQK